MKHLILFSFFSFLILIYNPNLKALGGLGSPDIFTACLDCDSTKVEDMIREHYVKEFNNLGTGMGSSCAPSEFDCAPGDSGRDLLSDNWIVFTDLGGDKGVKYSGSLKESGEIFIIRNFFTKAVETKYWQDMTQLRALLISSRIAIEAGLAEMSGATKAQSVQNKLNYKDDENGRCVGNTETSSAFDYFNGSSRMTIDAALGAQLDNYTPEINGQISEVNIGVGASSSGVNATLGITITFNEELGHLTSSFSNGYLIFGIKQGLSGFYHATLDLQASVIGHGISNSSGVPLTNVRLSSFFHANDLGDWTVNNDIDVSFTDPCLSEDFEDAVNEDFEYDSGETGIDMSNNGWQGCFNSRVLEMTHRITWETYTTRTHRRADGKLVMILVVVHHSMELPDNNDTSEYDRTCFHFSGG